MKLTAKYYISCRYCSFDLSNLASCFEGKLISTSCAIKEFIILERKKRVYIRDLKQCHGHKECREKNETSYELINLALIAQVSFYVESLRQLQNLKPESV